MNIETVLDRICEELEGDIDDAGVERTFFTFVEAQQWAMEYGFSAERPAPIIQGLLRRNKTMTERIPPRRFRTIGSNPHDRWQASPTFSGSGAGSIYGMAGTAG